jgi:hypothetical protein
MKRLSEFGVVVVNPPWRGALRSDSFECHVLAVIGNTAAIEPINRASTLWLPERLDGALLSFRHEGSLVGLCGTLWLRKTVGDLRYTVTDGIHTGLRRATTVDVCAPITLRPAGGAQPVEGLTMNLSAFAILVSSAELDAQPGDVVGFSLALPGIDEALEAEATVVRLADGRVDLEVDVGDRVARSCLARFVVNHNRSLLRRRPQAELELDF